MGAPTVFSSTDTDAPVLYGVYGSLIALLDAVLINGYGSKAPLGWTKEISVGEKAVYRSSVAGVDPIILRIDDSSANGMTSLYAGVKCYESMSGIDTGAALWHTGYVRKSTGANTAPATWIVIGDAHGFYIFTLYGYDSYINNTYYAAHYFGAYKDVISVNSWTAMACSGKWLNSLDYQNYPLTFNLATDTAMLDIANNNLHRKPSGDIGSLGYFCRCACNSYMPFGEQTQSRINAPSANNLSSAYNYPYGGKLVLSPLVLIDTNNMIIGAWPNAYNSPHPNLTSMTDITIEGTTYIAIPIIMGKDPLYSAFIGSRGAILIDITSDFRG